MDMSILMSVRAEGTQIWYWSAVQQLTPLLFPVTYSDGTLPVYGGSRELASPYVMLNNTGYMQSEDNRNMLTLKLTQEFGGFLKGLTMSVQAMDRNISATSANTAGFGPTSTVLPDEPHRES